VDARIQHGGVDVKDHLIRFKKKVRYWESKIHEKGEKTDCNEVDI
jgi:hypothetical protein